MRSPTEEDFEEEGLLAGLEGENRAARLKLLEKLTAEGAGLDELRDAVAAGRLALLPVERLLDPKPARYTPQEVADQADISLEMLTKNTAALGLPVLDPDDRSLTDEDLAAAKRLRAVAGSGLPEEGVLQVSRTFGMATFRIAEANRESVRALVTEDDSEFDIATRIEAAAAYLMPLVSKTLIYAMQKHMLEGVRRSVLDTQAGGDSQTGTYEMSVCFADLVGFTKLGERIPMDELGRVAGRLEEMAVGVAASPVRLIKLIGDAAMLVSPDPKAMVGAALDLVEAADSEGEDFPQLRAGLASGPALAQAGDWYGRPVNLASRITEIARPGSVLGSQSLREEVGDAFRHSFAGERRIKGIDGQVKLFRLRRPEPERD